MKKNKIKYVVNKNHTKIIQHVNDLKIACNLLN